GLLLLDDRVPGIARFVARAPAPPEQPPPTTSAARAGAWAPVIVLGLAFYSTIAVVLFPSVPLLSMPARALAPFRVANPYGLFATMTGHGYETESQESGRAGARWITYPFP